MAADFLRIPKTQVLVRTISTRSTKTENMTSNISNTNSHGEATIPPPMNLGFRLETQYNEETGLLHAFNLGLEKFQPHAKGDHYDYDFRKRRSGDESDNESSSCGWSGSYSIDLGGFSSSDVAVMTPGTIVHVLFHYHDNYCDCAIGYLDREAAEEQFHKHKNEMWKKIEEWKKWNCNHDFAVVQHDRWHCDLLECELTGRP